MEGDVEFQNKSTLFQKGVEILPGLTQGLGHGGVHFSSGPLITDQLIGLFQQLLHGALLALLTRSWTSVNTIKSIHYSLDSPVICEEHLDGPSASRKKRRNSLPSESYPDSSPELAVPSILDSKNAKKKKMQKKKKKKNPSASA